MERASRMGKIRTRYFVALLSFICLIFLFSCGTAGTGNSNGNNNGNSDGGGLMTVMLINRRGGVTR